MNDKPLEDWTVLEAIAALRAGMLASNEPFEGALRDQLVRAIEALGLALKWMEDSWATVDQFKEWGLAREYLADCVTMLER